MVEEGKLVYLKWNSAWNKVSLIKGEMQVKGIWKQDPEANIWAQGDENGEWRKFQNEERRMRMGVEKAPQWGTS